MSEQEHRHISFKPMPEPAQGLLAAAKAHRKVMEARRSLRFFSTREVGRELIEELILIAGTAPSGAHKQPWTFVAISDADKKREIRKAAEIEERHFYESGAGAEWLRDLSPLGTDWEKPFLEDAPWLIAVFRQSTAADGSKHYYTQESVGIACGFLIAAIHQVGLVTLTHTPSPMNFLSHLLERPAHEKPFLLLPIGYPAHSATVPDLKRKSLGQIAIFHEGPAQ